MTDRTTNPYGEAMQEAITTIALQHSEIERLRAELSEAEAALGKLING